MERSFSTQASAHPDLTLPADSLIKRWKIGAVLVIVIAVIVNAILGNVLFTLFGWVSITMYGLVVIARKIIQIYLAISSNRSRRLTVRRPLVEEFARQYPHLADRAYALLRQNQPYEAFKTAFLQLLEDAHDEYELQSLEESPAPGRSDTLPWLYNSVWVQRKWEQIMSSSFPYMPYVGLVIPTYRTSKLELQRLVESLENQTYPHLWVSIVLNENSEELKSFTHKLIRKYGGGKYIRFVEPRKGKRNAMRMGFADFLDDPQVKYVFNVDSDSKLHPDAIANAVRLFESDPDIGCLTGDIHVANTDVNLLTRLTAQRFFYAFNVERAAQNRFDAVTCMSGAFMAVRARVLREILNPWANQRFLGQACNFGDDRHISTLVLERGLKSVYCPDSISLTDVPHEMPVWKRQQTRWARSAWRETLITLPWLHRLPLWIVFEVAYLLVFPFILWGILIALGYRAVIYGPQVLLPYFAVVIALNFIFNAFYGIVVNRDFRYLLGPLYLFYQFVYLQPLRLWALISLDITRWGTK